MAEDTILNHEQINQISTFMEEIEAIYDVEVPILSSDHPLFSLWETPIDVTEGRFPDPLYTATGDITHQFPFNFAQSTELNPVMNLKIDVFRPAPDIQSMRGVKVTVFQVPNSPEVIVRYDKDVPPAI